MEKLFFAFIYTVFFVYLMIQVLAFIAYDSLLLIFNKKQKNDYIRHTP